MRIRPAVASTKRKNDNAKVLLPEPVRPKMPTYRDRQLSRSCLTRYINLLAGLNGEIEVMQHIREVRLLTRNETKMSTREHSDHLRHI